MEERLSPDQAAVAGGPCGPNITATNAHLCVGQPGEPPPGDDWTAFLGDDAQVAEEHIEEIVSQLPPCPSTAAFFADQNKVFERVAIQWAASLLAGRGFPLRLTRSLLGLRQRRAARFLRDTYKGPLRELLRSVDIGGTASPLLWCPSYDLVIAATANVAGARCPTYVDDLAALLTGARQALQVAVFLPWVSRAIGLLIATHACCTLFVSEVIPALKAALATLPVDWREGRLRVRVTGLTPELTRKLLARRLGPALGPTSVHATHCRCSHKSTVVPSHHKSWWVRLMEHSPFDGGSVRD